eukprot:5038721-Amphidinium_carterae.1
MSTFGMCCTLVQNVAECRNILNIAGVGFLNCSFALCADLPEGFRLLDWRKSLLQGTLSRRGLDLGSLYVYEE